MNPSLYYQKEVAETKEGGQLRMSNSNLLSSIKTSHWINGLVLSPYNLLV